MKNVLSIDLEDYMHVTAFADQVAADQWTSCVSRLERNTDKVLAILDDGNCKATFFVLGWVAEQYPHVVRRIADLGHEIACHSLRHRLVYQMTPAEFREDTRIAKSLLEDSGSKPVSGYRAPSFSITKESWWAFEILSELGFTYDSSIFPVHHPNYGLPGASRFPFVIQTASGPILEFPLPTLQVGRRRAPLGGGAYLRLLPYAFTHWGIQHINQRELRPVCVYVHPWELDADQPRMQGSMTARLRHYLGLRGTESKFRNLLRDFEFGPLEDLFLDWVAAGSSDTFHLEVSSNAKH